MVRCDLIRQATGDTATAIIRNFVMQRATAYLHDGKTISETSELLGFEYPQHFTRVFKKHFGLTPSEFLRKKETIDPIASTDINGDATVVSDGTKSHINFPKMFSEHVGRKIDPKEIGKVLPWVHIAISNSKSLMKNIHHGVKPEFLQEYLNEFCYKFNRRLLWRQVV